MIDRRTFLGMAGAGVAGATLGLSGAARANVSPADRKFLFIFCTGGWDTTRVLSPMMSSPLIDSEPTAEAWSIHGLSLVDEPGRPAVRRFFENWGAQTAVVNGVLVPSVAHETCATIAMTGGTRGTPDFAAMLASFDADRYTLPNLVMDGPSYPAELGYAVARAGSSGQLEGLVSGDILPASDRPRPDPRAAGLVDRWLERRSAARAAAARSERERIVIEAFDNGLMRAHDLKAQRHVMSFAGDGSFDSRARVAADALATGMSRVVTLGFPDAITFAWDTHDANDNGQTLLWNDLCDGLDQLMALLQLTPGMAGGSLLDETTVVVLSEMGRTPQLNANLGKDHWPYTSAMLLGSGVAGGQMLGAFDDQFRGTGVDRQNGGPGSTLLNAAHIGATLVALAGEDPVTHVASVEGPLEALLA